MHDLTHATGERLDTRPSLHSNVDCADSAGFDSNSPCCLCMNYTPAVVTVLASFYLHFQALGSGSVEIRLIQFKNDDGLHFSGSSCDTFFFGNCNTYFIICYSSQSSTSTCGVQYTTGVYENTNSITFSSTLKSGIANPLKFPFSGSWQVKLHLGLLYQDGLNFHFCMSGL